MRLQQNLRLSTQDEEINFQPSLHGPSIWRLLPLRHRDQCIRLLILRSLLSHRLTFS
jgi:hypothetical protein